MSIFAKPPKGEISLGYGKTFDTEAATLISQSDHKYARDGATFLYKTKEGFSLIRAFSVDDFEAKDLHELDAQNWWLRHQTGRIHVPFEEAFPNAEVEVA
jgi:hypothetical protein